MQIFSLKNVFKWLRFFAFYKCWRKRISESGSKFIRLFPFLICPSLQMTQVQLNNHHPKDCQLVQHLIPYEFKCKLKNLSKLLQIIKGNQRTSLKTQTFDKPSAVMILNCPWSFWLPQLQFYFHLSIQMLFFYSSQEPCEVSTNISSFINKQMQRCQIPQLVKSTQESINMRV